MYARLSVAADALVTVKPPVSVTLPPPGFVTITSRAPGAAPAAMASVAVICPAPTDTFDTVIPAPTLTVAPDTKPDPLIVMGTDVPTAPWFGAIVLTLRAAATVVDAIAVEPSENVAVSVRVLPERNSVP